MEKYINFIRFYYDTDDKSGDYKKILDNFLVIDNAENRAIISKIKKRQKDGGELNDLIYNLELKKLDFKVIEIND